MLNSRQLVRNNTVEPAICVTLSFNLSRVDCAFRRLASAFVTMYLKTQRLPSFSMYNTADPNWRSRAGSVTTIGQDDDRNVREARVRRVGA